MGAGPLLNFYRTLLSVARVEAKYCQNGKEHDVVQREIHRFEQQLVKLGKPKPGIRSSRKKDVNSEAA